MSKTTLLFVVNGEDVLLEVNPHEPLEAARNQALAKTNNTGRPPSDWELRLSSGEIIDDVKKKIESFGFPPGTRLFLNLHVGAGGN